jgi:uncharacterized membrane protein (DUF2068 family)
MSFPRRHERAGLKAVALFEAAKGLVVVTAGLGLLTLLHRDIQAAAEELVRDSHFNPASEFPRIFLHLADQLNDARVWALAAGAAAYASVRFAEGYGLWRERAWAEWLGIVSGAMYVPIEVYELSRRVTGARVVVLACNIGIVAWLGWVRWIHRGGDRNC